jgi:hypothetical protein
MMREWRRLYRLRGFTPFGILLVVLLAVLLAADRVTERWSASAQKRDEIEQQLAGMHATLERSRQIDAALEAARGRLAAVAGKVVTASDTKAAGQLLAQAAEKWLVSMGATGGATGKNTKALDSGERAASGVVEAEVAVRVMPQQLLRILDEWHKAPLAMRLVRLEVTVDNPNAPTALEALLRVEGVFQRSESGSKADSKSGSQSGSQSASQSASQSGSKAATTDRAGPSAPRSARTQDAR